MDRNDATEAGPTTANVDLGAMFGKTMTDPVNRAALFADPAGFLSAVGLAVPTWLTVTVVEVDVPSLTIGVAPLLDEHEIAEEFLNSVGGAGFPPWL
ncbi:MAG: hypothetical protein WCP26_02920 [Actinomycetes bacterium]